MDLRGQVSDILWHWFDTPRLTLLLFPYYQLIPNRAWWCIDRRRLRRGQEERFTHTTAVCKRRWPDVEERLEEAGASYEAVTPPEDGNNDGKEGQVDCLHCRPNMAREL